MIKRGVLLVVIVVFIIVRYTRQEKNNNVNNKVEQLVEFSKSYIGTAYKAGGTTKRGMDCSGLVTTVFKEFDIKLPRSSELMSREGVEVNFNEVNKGDLLFFDITHLQGGINHVGLVIFVENNNVMFIHSTTSKGVILTSINELYWKEAFVKAKRLEFK